MLIEIQKYIDGKSNIDMKGLGIEFYKTYNDIYKQIFKVLVDEPESKLKNKELYNQLVISYTLFSKIIGKLSSNDLDYEKDDILKEYNGLIPTLKIYFENEFKIDEKSIRLISEYFERIDKAFRS